MKKTFKLNVEGKHPDRHIESIKHEIRKYIKREKKKKLPEGFDLWRLDCKFAKDADSPREIEFTAITKNIDDAVSSNCDTFYMEIISSAVKRKKREK